LHDAFSGGILFLGSLTICEFHNGTLALVQPIPRFETHIDVHCGAYVGCLDGVMIVEATVEAVGGSLNPQ